jgi:uncharacterized protein (DUF58 family)
VRVVNPLGWAILVAGLALAWAAAQTGWREVAVVSAAFLLLLVLALPFLLGRTNVRVEVVLEPQRVVAGESVAAGLSVTNTAPRRLLPTLLELPVGATVQRYAVPSLAPRAAHEETFTVRTERRGVITVGPATTRRGDPLSIYSRDVAWTGITEILVRPPMVPLDSLGAGLLRDLEGVSTDAVSQSDLAFHALREYTPGDDLRHVHWRSSAKASQLLVRQYLDTRRSHATIVVDDAPSSWATDDDFETAMSVAASIAVRAVLDEFEATFVCGEHVSSGSDGTRALDAVCRAGLTGSGLVAAANRAARTAPDTSLLFLVSGAGTSFEAFQRAAAVFPPEARRFAMIVDATGRTRVTETGGLPVLHLTGKDDLAALLHWSVR